MQMVAYMRALQTLQRDGDTEWAKVADEYPHGDIALAFHGCLVGGVKAAAAISAR